MKDTNCTELSDDNEQNNDMLVKCECGWTGDRAINSKGVADLFDHKTIVEYRGNPKLTELLSKNAN